MKNFLPTGENFKPSAGRGFSMLYGGFFSSCTQKEQTLLLGLCKRHRRGQRDTNEKRSVELRRPSAKLPARWFQRAVERVRHDAPDALERGFADGKSSRRRQISSHVLWIVHGIKKDVISERYNIFYIEPQSSYIILNK